MMVKPQWFFALGIVLGLLCVYSQARTHESNMMKSAVFHSPEFIMERGSVVNRIYSNIDFPRGHIGIKNFNAEVVDEAGKPVPLQETYLHHWVVVRYYKRIDAPDNELQRSDFLSVRNSGLCNNLGQYFGLGSETRKTATHVPDPYAIEVGNPAEIPAGYEERWMLNVHAIDTRGVVDGLGCTECRCNLYNITVDEYGRPLRPDYDGGLLCCYEKAQCKVKEGLANSPRRLYLKYTVKWFDWDYSLLPVNIYIFDITDTVSVSKDFTESHHCKIEYEVSPCRSSALSNGCIDSKRVSFKMPQGGYVIYGVAHQHSGGIGSALYRKDGQVVCSSKPTYGKGKEAGNEEGYIVGMSTCYPEPGSLVIDDGETLVLESNYSSSQKHTGVMGLFYILVADQVPKKKSYLETLISKVEGTQMPVAPGMVPILVVVVVVAVVAISTARLRKRNHAEYGYSPISM